VVSGLLFSTLIASACAAAAAVAAAMQLDQRIGAVVLGWDCQFNYQKVMVAGWLSV
jgi:hypothetical protein